MNRMNREIEARVNFYVCELTERVAAGIAAAVGDIRQKLLDEGADPEAIDAEIGSATVAALAANRRTIRQAIERLWGVPLSHRAHLAHETVADAMLDLHGQIVERYGDHPDTLDDLVIRTLPCPHEGSKRRGMVIVAHPRSGVNADASNVIWAYYGDEPASRGGEGAA